MSTEDVLSRVVDYPAIDRIAKPLSQAVRDGFESAGPVGQQAKNALHGVWLGHPLHPVFTDIPIGAWTTGLVLDTVAATNKDHALRRAGDVAIAVGLVGAVASAITGLTDWSETSGRSRRAGLVHGLLNITATALYATAYILRRNGSRRAGQSCAIAGYGIPMGSAYLGGTLVYDQRIGVT